MPQATEKSRSAIAAHPVRSAIIAILVTADIFFVLVTPIYARTTPKIGSWPFFYWYLLIFMPVTSLVLWIVTQLQKPIERASQERAAAGQEGGIRS